MDWILALVGEGGTLLEFVAMELQNMDTTGSYEAEVRELLGKEMTPRKNSGINWENVSKRILPQVIFKGHVLRNEHPFAKRVSTSSVPVQYTAPFWNGWVAG